ncbi:MarP family serine protease [Rarobacter incanus]|uniref:Colicin V production protein n=1 Tax=Rarobacter incanus TaxID=153494 RepID=A0A542SRS0_9MICO|nr:MarP family serine protease [Rarobacter incanus]TQK77278.1 colicin V production protein [Rarobacter incanus]
MSGTDIALIAGLVIAFVAGARRGLLGTLAMVCGFIVGAILAGFAIPWATGQLPSQHWRVPIAVALALFLPIGGARLGGYLGTAARANADGTRLGPFDRMAGATLSAAGLGLVYSLVASLLVSLGIPGLSTAAASSQVVGAIERIIPAPAQRLIAAARASEVPSAIASIGDIFGLGDQPAVPTFATQTPQIRTALESVAAISGAAVACGITSSGSGFFVDASHVMTNAHVVAGVNKPIIQAPGGYASSGIVVYFDEGSDVAIIKVKDEGPRPLALVPNMAKGSRALVAGYPYGGPLSVGNAIVTYVGKGAFQTQDGKTTPRRQMYAMAADIEPGNSGGPVLTESGEVAGMVFAASTTAKNLGYALSASEIEPAMNKASSLSAAVPTGSCQS